MSDPEPLPHVSLPADRWVLVPPRSGYEADVLAMFNDPEVQRWNPAPNVVDTEKAADWLARSAAWEARWAVWIILEPGGRFAGTSLLWNMDRADHMNGSVGYRIAPWARRQGVATAAVRAMTAFAFDEVGLARLDLVHTIANAGSCLVAERAGFILEGTLRSEYRTLDGRRWDCHIHSRLATDPRPGA
jgi:RimJ/RimL family protein N-acetyltransferase